MTFKGKEITKELLEKAEKCQTADELIALAKEIDIGLTVDEAQAFLDENADIQLDAEQINAAAGGRKRSAEVVPLKQEIKAIIKLIGIGG